MPEFLSLLPPLDALRLLFENFSPHPQAEDIETTTALGRVSFARVIAPYPLPPFPRSTVDGYAVRAAGTYGANFYTSLRGTMCSYPHRRDVAKGRGRCGNG